MPETPLVKRLGPDDGELLVQLRAEALRADPFAFAASPEDDQALCLESVQQFLAKADMQVVAGAFDGESLVGMAGISRETKLKRQHIAHIWGVYVSPPARGKGIGRLLMEEVIEVARGWMGVEMIQLGAATKTPTPIRLYESLGFRTWGVERNAVKWNGEYTDDAQMVLEL